MTTVSHVLEFLEESYTVYEVEMEGERYCQLLLDEGIALGEPGEPELPLMLVSLAVPGRIVDPEMVYLDVACGETIEVPLEAPLWPIQPPSLPQEEGQYERVWLEGPDGEPISYYKPEPFRPPRPEAYEEPTPHPEVVGRIASVKPGRLVSLVHLWVAPIHYFPAEQLLTVAREVHLYLEVETVESEIVHQLRELAGMDEPVETTFPPPESYVELPYPLDDEVEFEQLDINAIRFLWDDLGDRQGYVANPQVIQELYGVLHEGIQSSVMYFQQSRPYWPYLIITDDNYWLPDHQTAKKVPDPDPAHSSTMTTEFQRLADWKSQKGVPAKVVRVEYIQQHWTTRNNSSLPVRDVPEAIREFLKYAHRMWGTRWVLLGGDIEIVPGRRVVWPQPHSYNIIWPSPSPQGNTFKVQDLGAIGYCLKMTIKDPLPNYSLNQQHALVEGTLPIFFSEKTHRKFEYNPDAGKQPDGTLVEGWRHAKDTTFSEAWTKYPTRFIELYTAQKGETEHIFFFADPLNRWCLPIADFYYSSLLGSEYDRAWGLGWHDWDLGNIGFYGLSAIEDRAHPQYPNLGGVHWDHFDVHVGRAPVFDVQQARAFVDRVLIVDRLRTLDDQPVDTGFTQQLLLFSGFENHKNDQQGWVDRYATRAGRVHRVFDKGHARLKYQVVERFYSDAFDYWRHKDWGDEDRKRWPGAWPPKPHDNRDPQTVLDVINTWNRGYGYISIQAHGGRDGTERNFITLGILKHLTNAPAYGVAYAYSCSTAHFDDYRMQLEPNHKQYYHHKLDGDFWKEACLGESIVAHPGGGVAAYVGESRACWADSNLQNRFWSTGLELIKLGRTPRLGAMFASMDSTISAKSDKWSRSVRILSQLFGDPEMTVWFGYTLTMKLTAPQTVQAGSTFSIEVLDSQGLPFHFARVSLWQRGHPPLVKYPDQSGKVQVQTSGTLKGSTIRVTVTGDLHRPAFAEIKVT